MKPKELDLLIDVVAHETGLGRGKMIANRETKTAREMVAAGLLSAPSGLAGHIHSTHAGRRALAEERLRESRDAAMLAGAPDWLVETIVDSAAAPCASWAVVSHEYASYIRAAGGSKVREALADVFIAAKAVAEAM